MHPREMDLSSFTCILLFTRSFIISISFVCYLAYTRLYLSPLAKIPGPKLAALTLWYEFYYDVIQRGQYVFKIKQMHEQYGPIIRINPYEVHISDPDFYDTLYASSASGEKRDKWEWYTKQFGTPSAGFSTPSHDQHKPRRAALNQFFSMASVRRLQPLIEERVNQLVKRFREYKDLEGGNGIIKIDDAFAAFSNDVVMAYSYGRFDHRIEDRNWGPEYADAVKEACRNGSLLKQMFFIFTFMNSLPQKLVSSLSSSFDLVLRIQRRTKRQIIKIKKQPASSYKNAAHPTIFHEILSSNLPESEKSIKRLKDEADIMIGAGTMPTSWALTVATYHLLRNSHILRNLKYELHTAIPNKDDDASTVPLATLENLPYFTAIIQEALRLSYGVATRLQRISPHKPLLFHDHSTHKDWLIPAGTPVGMTSILLHQDASIFPDPLTFRPERWIQDPSLERYMVSFSKGSRQCLGINLAYAELYLCLGGVFRRFGSKDVRAEGDEGYLELWETSAEDVDVVGDGFIPLVREGSMGVRVRLRGWED